MMLLSYDFRSIPGWNGDELTRQGVSIQMIVEPRTVIEISLSFFPLFVTRSRVIVFDCVILC